MKLKIIFSDNVAFKIWVFFWREVIKKRENIKKSLSDSRVRLRNFFKVCPMEGSSFLNRCIFVLAIFLLWLFDSLIKHRMFQSIFPPESFIGFCLQAHYQKMFHFFRNISSFWEFYFFVPDELCHLEWSLAMSKIPWKATKERLIKNYTKWPNVMLQADDSVGKKLWWKITVIFLFFWTLAHWELWVAHSISLENFYGLDIWWIAELNLVMVN